MRGIGIRHNRNCHKAICNMARMKRRLTIALKRKNNECTNRWLKCSNCCHEFVDLSLQNFHNYLCARHEDDARQLLHIQCMYRRRICQINRHLRFRYLQHKHVQLATLGTNVLVECPNDLCPSANVDLLTMHTTLNVPASQHTNNFQPPNYMQPGNMFTPHTFGPPTITCSYCGALVWYEERVKNGSTLSSPKFSLCCQKGKVQLPTYQQAPQYLLDLLDYNGGLVSKLFRQNIRAYNSVFAFTSMGGHIDNSINNGRGPYVFRLNGQNHHRVGSLLPTEGKPKFAQLYFYDTSNEVNNRLTAHGGSMSNILDEEIVQNLICMFNQYNGLAKVFRMARDRFHSNEYQPITIKLMERRYGDGRQYNLPTCSEIAALSDTSNVDSCGYRDIVIEERSGILKRISEKHPSFMSMQYHVLFPYGEDGFRCNIQYMFIDVGRSTKRTTVTMRKYYAYLIQYRCDDASVLLLGGRLFQQFVVDCYTCIEEDRLSWVKCNQTTLRSELYNGLHDAITAGDTSARAIGRRVIFPSSFTGGPRYMVQNYQDAMAICRWAGSPDYFVTFTCNPKWPEIELGMSNIPGQKTEDRPDIVSRVFHMKLMELMTDIKAKGHFGKVKALVYTIEFQKRGLPHAHILIFIFGDQRPKTVGQVDAVVSAELPDKNVDLLAYESVCQFMIHGPCGYVNPLCPCMVKGSCSKHFPKAYSNETTFDKLGFPIYRRRNTGITKESENGFSQDNGWVIPHNVDLVVKYQAHINVEVCNRARSVKYLFKYINKGHDRATVVIEENTSNEQTFVREVDEVKTFLDCRYISASEASWRIFEFDVQYRTPAVERLTFHMPGEQTVFFDESDSLHEIQQRNTIDKTMFIQWLETNKTSDYARQLTYVDFPTKWVWDKSTKMWKMRQKGSCIGRIFYAHPTSGERYYLRMLLNIVRGPTSYADIRKVDTIVHDTFKDACIARGLLEDDNEWDDALSEAAIWSSPKSLRELFATMLLFCEVSNPKKLWDNHWENLSEDIEWRRSRSNGAAHSQLQRLTVESETLLELERIMSRNNRSLKEFWSLSSHEFYANSATTNTLIEDEANYDYDLLRDEGGRLVSKLNEDQRIVYESVIHAVQTNSGGFFFVYGSGGTGKTFLWKTLICTVRAEGKIVLAVASSGIASLLLLGGRTAHSKFKIPIDLHDMSMCNISKQSCLADLLRQTDLIIWDEAPMVHRNALEAFEKSLNDIVSSDSTSATDQIFGGKTIVLGGDFR